MCKYSKVLWTIFRHNRVEVTRDRRKVRNEELCNLYLCKTVLLDFIHVQVLLRNNVSEVGSAAVFRWNEDKSLFGLLVELVSNLNRACITHRGDEKLLQNFGWKVLS
jgi:hypothetical protein